MASFEELFNTSVLDVIVPIASVGFPSPDPTDVASKWLDGLDGETIDRKTAFFGKVHYSYNLPVIASRLIMLYFTPVIT